MSYDYKVIKCSSCHTVTECVAIWSNVIPWLCEKCCEKQGEYWSEEQEERDNE